MSFVSLVFGLGGAQTRIGALTLDALLVEDTELSAAVTRFAVEDGDEPVTDHIVQDAERLSLSGVVTSAGVTLFGAGGRSKLIAAKEALRLIHAGRLPITISTGMDVYENMGMSHAKLGRAGTTERMTVDCEFYKIRKAMTRTADVPPERVAPKAKGKAGPTAAKAGKANPNGAQKAPADAIDQSTLDALVNGKKAAPPPTASPGVIST